MAYVAAATIGTCQIEIHHNDFSTATIIDSPMLLIELEVSAIRTV